MNAAAKRKGVSTITKKRFPIGLVILLAATVGAWSGCSHEPLPSRLVGSWISPDARFEGRVLTITPRTVAISVHGESAAFYFIKETSVVLNNRLWKVSLALEDTQHTASRMTLNYDPQRDTLRLENRPATLWHRSAGLISLQ